MISKVVLLAVASLVVVVAIVSAADLADLEIHTLYKPEVCKKKASTNDFLRIHYNGTLENGQKFDSSYSRNEPLRFQLGVGQVIKGWDRGLANICEGERRRLVIPPFLGYGNMKQEKIPANSVLLFDVECVKVESSVPLMSKFISWMG